MEKEVTAAEPVFAAATCPRCGASFRLAVDGTGRYQTSCPNCDHWPVTVDVK